MKQIFMSSVVLAAGETDRAKWLDSLKSGTVLLIPKKKYINLKQNANKQGKKVHTQKKTVIKSVLVTDISCRFYDMTKLL